MNLARLLPMSITLWLNPVPTGNGAYSFSSPITVPGRYEEKQVLFRDAQGREVLSQAIVYSETDFQVGAYVFNGTSAVANPLEVAGAKEIRQIGKSPSVSGLQFLCKAFL